MSSTIKELVQTLHQSLQIPLFLIKTHHGEIFHVHENSMFLAPHLKEIFSKYKKSNSADTKLIHLVDIKELPDLGMALDVDKDGDFSIFFPTHQLIASKLTSLFMSIADLKDVLSMVAYVRDRVHSKMFFYSLAVALAHRPDTKDLSSDVLMAFPTDFIPAKHLIEATKMRKLGIYTSPTDSITISDTGTYLDEEYRVAYFREDIAINCHHWYWHIVNAFSGKPANNDRRGELFFYMHQQMMGRYNTERLCAYLPRVVPFDDFRKAIPQGYFSKLYSYNSSRDISGRAENLTWKDINRLVDHMVIAVGDMLSYKMRIEQAIDTGMASAVDENGIEAFVHH